MIQPLIVHNLYWQKYLKFGYHSLISEYMDMYGVDIYKEVVDRIKEAKQRNRTGIPLLKLGRDKMCYVHKSEYDDILDECMKFFLHKEEYLECARIRDIDKVVIKRPMRERTKALI